MRGAARSSGARPSLAGGPALLIGAAAWALTALYFPVEPYVAAAFSPSYGFAGNTISDLGSVACGDVVQFGGEPVPVCSPRQAVMNAAFAVLGVLTAAGAVLTGRVWPAGRAATAGVVGVALAGVGAVLVALAPQDVNLPVHAVGAVLQLPGAVAPLAFWLALDRRDRVLRALSLVLGAVGSAASLLFFGGTSLGLGVGAMERLAMWPLTAWTAAVGVLLLVRVRRSARVRVPVRARVCAEVGASARTGADRRGGPMATVLTAKYRTRCAACAQPIQPGERMALLGERGSGQWVHASCHPSGEVSAAAGSAVRTPASAPRRERPRRPDMAPPEGAVEVFTDGACSGNPGPGGWAWAVADGRQGSGGEATTTNQRMELRAVLEALRALDGPLVVVSDSTYVVNCFRDEWWKGWQARGWRNSAKQPVANRDLWEPLVELVTARGDVSFRWVKGHSGDAMNDLVDQLAVAAAAAVAAA